MPSKALAELNSALEEIDHLEMANPSPTGAAPKMPEVTRAVGRASVVLTCSHLERYVRAVNEEAIDLLMTTQISPTAIPSELRLLHSHVPIEKLATARWQNRANSLAEFINTDAWLWGPASASPISNKCLMDHSRILKWFKTPNPKNLLRYYRYWGIDDIFSSITRRTTTRSHLWLSIKGLVEKRNLIAHGDAMESATQRDSNKYKKVVGVFCTRADRIFGKQLTSMLGTPKLW